MPRNENTGNEQNHPNLLSDAPFNPDVDQLNEEKANPAPKIPVEVEVTVNHVVGHENVNESANRKFNDRIKLNEEPEVEETVKVDSDDVIKVTTPLAAVDGHTLHPNPEYVQDTFFNASEYYARENKNEQIDKAEMYSAHDTLEEYGDEREKEDLIEATNAMLETFASGMQSSEEGRKALNKLAGRGKDNVHYLYNLTDNFKSTDLNKGYKGLDPTVEEMLERGRHILIPLEDGNVTTFTDKFFMDEDGPNPTVKHLQQMEKEGKSNFGYAANIMAYYMSLYLSESKDGPFKSIDKAFGNLNPSDREKGIPNVVITPVSETQKPYVVVSRQAKQRYDESVNTIKEREDRIKNWDRDEKPTLIEREENYNKAKKAKEEHQARKPADVPEKEPVEKNIFRRFFCKYFGMRHSKEYNEEVRQRNLLIEENQKWLFDDMDRTADLEKAKKKYDEVKDLSQRLKDDLKLRKDAFAKDPEMKAVERVDKNAPDVVRAVNLMQEGQRQRMVRHMARNPEVQEFVMQSKLITPLGFGAAASILEYMNHFADGAAHIEARNARKTEILERLDPEMFSEIKNKVGLGGLHEACAKAVDQKCKDAMKAFKDTFGMEPTSDNLMTVINATGLEQTLREHVERNESGSNRDFYKENKLPMPKEGINNDMMSLLIMSGMKSLLNLRSGKQIEEVDPDDVKVRDISADEMYQTKQPEEKKRAAHRAEKPHVKLL